MLLMKPLRRQHGTTTRGRRKRLVVSARPRSSSRTTGFGGLLLLPLLLTVLTAITTLSPSCLAIELTSNSTFNENDGGGGGIMEEEKGPLATLLANLAQNLAQLRKQNGKMNLYQNASYQIGNVTVSGTNFDSSVNGTDLSMRVPGVVCGVESEFVKSCVVEALADLENDDDDDEPTEGDLVLIQQALSRMPPACCAGYACSGTDGPNLELGRCVPTQCASADEKSNECGANPDNGHPEKCCPGLVCGDVDDEDEKHYCVVDEEAEGEGGEEAASLEPTLEPTEGPTATARPTTIAWGNTTEVVDGEEDEKGLLVMFVGDSGGGPNGQDRASFHDNWIRLTNVGKEDLNLKVQYRKYAGKNDLFTVEGGINKFVILSSFEDIDETNPIVDFRYERFDAATTVDGNGTEMTPASLALVAPTVQTVDGGVVVVMFLLHSDAGGRIITGIETPALGFQVLSSAVSKSGESMAAFVGRAVNGGGCVDPEPVAAEVTTRSGGIAMSLSLRPAGGLVEPFFPPCDEDEFARWNATRSIERDALERLYGETGGPSGWKRKGGWLEPDVDHCNWEGVTCDVQGLATELKLTRNGLKGSFPSFEDLKNMNNVDFSTNDLGGELDISNIPASLGSIILPKNKFKKLLGEIPATLRKLDLSENVLEGTCCNVISQNSNFTDLNLAQNNLKSVDVSTATKLHVLDISNNEPLDQSISDLGLGNLYDLKELKLRNKRGSLTGDLSLGHMQSLTYLDANGLGLKGDIGNTGIADMVNLTKLDLGGGNQFTGEFDICKFTLLQVLILDWTEGTLDGGNNLSGDVSEAGCHNLTSIQQIRLRGNNFTGMFSSIAQQTELEYVDLSHNNFYGPLPIDVQLGKLRYLDLSNNELTGPLPAFAAPVLQYLYLMNNELRGTISPNIGVEMPILQRIDLSNQISSEYDKSTGERVTSGLSGQIPDSIGEISFLQKLTLNKNTLSGTIPESIALLSYLNELDLENNLIGGTMPATVNILEQLNLVKLANNRLEGPIPALSGARDVIREVTLSGNPDLESPCPFTLCDLDDLDLRTNNVYCPTERSALAKLYSETQGGEWINNEKWLTEEHHCEWEGVSCSEKNTGDVVGLELVLNGVNGELPDEFYKLTKLKKLDLNDNELRGTISPNIGNMTSLEYLRLSYNILTGSLPEEISQLSRLNNLSLVHLQGNRLTGELTPPPLIADPDAEQFYFIADCGDPQDAVSELGCDGCDMCCNSLEECQEKVSQADVRGAYESIGLLVGCVIAGTVVIWVIVRVLVKTNIIKLSNKGAANMLGSNAFEAAGNESVYSFYLTNRIAGWLVATIVLVVQALIFILFLESADIDNGDGDFVYSWRCPRNIDNCNDERAVSSYGWTMWAFLVFASLFDDIVNGFKLLLLSSGRGSYSCFICGFVLIWITALALYTSYFYNVAIAMTNTELIVNAVILLFINDIDEQMFSIVRIIRPSWADGIVNQAEAYSTELLEHNVADDDAGAAAKDIRTEGANDEFFDAPAEDMKDHVAPLESALSDIGSKNEDSGTDDISQDQENSFWSNWFGPKENEAAHVARKSAGTSTTGGMDVTDQSQIELVHKVELLQKQMTEMKREMQKMKQS